MARPALTAPGIRPADPSAPRFEPIADAWIERHGFAPTAGEHPDRGFRLALSTVPPVEDHRGTRGSVRVLFPAGGAGAV